MTGELWDSTCGSDPTTAKADMSEVKDLFYDERGVRGGLDEIFLHCRHTPPDLQCKHSRCCQQQRANCYVGHSRKHHRKFRLWRICTPDHSREKRRKSQAELDYE